MEAEIKLIAELNIIGVRYEVFTAVTMKNAVFWNVTPCGFCKNGPFRRDVAHPSSG
jgi:hypothetical protein